MEEYIPNSNQQKQAERITKMLSVLINSDQELFGSDEQTWATSLLYITAKLFKDGEHTFEDFKEQLTRSFDHYKEHLWEGK